MSLHAKITPEDMRALQTAADCEGLEMEFLELRADAARMDWLSAPGNATLISEWFYPEDGQHLRAFIDWCAAGNDPREFNAKG